MMADIQMLHFKHHQMHVGTIRENFNGFFHKQIQGDMMGRRLMGMVATPSPRDFEGMVCLNMLKDCPVTNDGIKTAHALFGMGLTTIRGNMVWHKPKCVFTDYVDILCTLVEVNKQVTLAGDVMFVNSVSFLVSKTRNINLITIEHAPSPRTATTLESLLQRIVCVYARTGFTVQTILMDIEFKKVRDHVPVLNVNTPAASEHEGNIEQGICLNKKRARGICGITR